MAITVIAGTTGAGKTLFSTTMSMLLKGSKYDMICSNYRMEHTDQIIRSLSDFDAIGMKKSVLVIMDEAYEDIDSRRSFDTRVNAFTRNLMQLRKRGGKGIDTDCWIITQDFFMIDYRIRQNTNIIIYPSIVSWTAEGKPEFMLVDLQKYHPVWGPGRTRSFSMYVYPFLGSYDTDEMVNATEMKDITLETFIEKYRADPRSKHFTRTELSDVIYVEAQGGIAKSKARMIAGRIKTMEKEDELREKGLI